MRSAISVFRENQLSFEIAGLTQLRLWSWLRRSRSALSWRGCGRRSHRRTATRLCGFAARRLLLVSQDCRLRPHSGPSKLYLVADCSNLGVCKARTARLQLTSPEVRALLAGILAPSAYLVAVSSLSRTLGCLPGGRGGNKYFLMVYHKHENSTSSQHRSHVGSSFRDCRRPPVFWSFVFCSRVCNRRGDVT